ncbi:MAG TPA: glycosyltransferase 87 family protein, partial [Actinomycetota bacterium]|nr:glycosyltransferase 87 family protein [Actinomycetota bacterium]
AAGPDAAAHDPDVHGAPHARTATSADTDEEAVAHDGTIADRGAVDPGWKRFQAEQFQEEAAFTPGRRPVDGERTRSGHRDLIVVLVVCALLLVAGFAFKAQCMSAGPWQGQQWSRYCYNDIQALYHSRQIDRHTFPYIWGYLLDDRLSGGGIEYPVLTGLFMWLTGLPTSTWNQFLAVSALALAPFGLLTSYLLFKMNGRRALYWAAAPALVLYAFHNWDLLVVAAAVAGIYLWWRRHPIAAGILFGIGGALKLYPLLFLIPLFIDTWTQDRKTGWRAWWSGIATVVLINLPIAFWNPPSWWLTYQFQSFRYPNVDSLWGQLASGVDPQIDNLVSAALILASVAGAVWWGWRHRSRIPEAGYPFLQVAAASMCAFLLWSKVQSPQYTLWLLPFFVVLAVRPRWWVTYSLVDLACYFGVFRFYGEFGHPSAIPVGHFLMDVSVLARAFMHAILFFVFLNAEPATGDPPEPRFVSHPVPTLQTSEI